MTIFPLKEWVSHALGWSMLAAIASGVCAVLLAVINREFWFANWVFLPLAYVAVAFAVAYTVLDLIEPFITKRAKNS